MTLSSLFAATAVAPAKSIAMIAYQTQRSIGYLCALRRVQARRKSNDVYRGRDEPHDARAPKIMRHEVRAARLLRKPECNADRDADRKPHSREHATAFSTDEV